jgi:hypothetical protein
MAPFGALLREYRPFLVAFIAIVLCWLLLNPRRKPPGGGNNNQGQQNHGAGGASSAAGSRSSSRGPVLSLSTVGTLIKFQGRVPQLMTEAAAALLRAAARADVHLITTLPDDSDDLERATMACLEAGGLFDGRTGGAKCDRRKVVFCATEDGRSAIVRQLAPAVHLDTSAKVLGYLQPHLPRVIFLSPDGLPPAGVPCASSSSLAAYVDAVFGAASPAKPSVAT